jgi:hypothetical protein
MIAPLVCIAIIGLIAWVLIQVVPMPPPVHPLLSLCWADHLLMVLRKRFDRLQSTVFPLRQHAYLCTSGLIKGWRVSIQGSNPEPIFQIAWDADLQKPPL